MIMGTPKFDNTKTWVAVQVTFTHPFPLTCLHNRCKFNPETFWWGSKKKVPNHWQETQENSSEVHNAEQT